MFIGRKLDRSVYGIWTVQQPDDEFHPNIEEVPDAHPDVVTFLARAMPVRSTDPSAKLNELEARVALLEAKKA